MSQENKNENILPELSQLEAELEHEQYRSRYNKALRSTIGILLVTAALAVLLAMLIMPVFRIYGTSMSPTVKEGEIVVTIKGSSFECGDVVVLSYNNKLLVKRVIAGPGQWVDIDMDGNVYVDDVLIDEPYLVEKAFGDCNISLPYQVPDEKYFVMGDNRSVSQDSRNAAIGCIEDEQIVGRAMMCVWPLSDFGTFK